MELCYKTWEGEQVKKTATDKPQEIMASLYIRTEVPGDSVGHQGTAVFTGASYHVTHTRTPTRAQVHHTRARGVLPWRQELVMSFPGGEEAIPARL